MRTEFGATRSVCSCESCRLNCRFMPGFLIPADLLRLLPQDADPLEWAERNLRASPGALVSKDGHPFRIHTLVPALTDSGCINLDSAGMCRVHAAAPFGCAFFDCRPDPRYWLSAEGLRAIMRDWRTPGSLYRRLWEHLNTHGFRQEAPEALRARMQKVYRETSGGPKP